MKPTGYRMPGVRGARGQVRLKRRARYGAAAAAGLAAAGLIVAGGAAPARADSTTQTFTYTGGEQTYTVPAGVTAVTITAVGAPGGAYDGEAVGGDGATVTAAVPVPAGTTTLYVEVGGLGPDQVSGNYGATGNAFNGGGSGGYGDGGGGGGASDVRTTSITTVPDSALTTSNDSRLVVAGGGGGAGSYCLGPANGGAGGDTSVTGAGNGGNALGGNCPTAGGNGGFGAPAGNGGYNDDGVGCDGFAGSLGQGADTNPPSNCDGGGGAGGGGYYGGGSGAWEGTGAGGGAGSSYWVPGATGTSMSPDSTGVPEVTITPGWAAATGTPTPAPHSAEGYYLGVNGNTWTLRVTQPGPAKITFTGTITVNAGHFSKITPLSPYGKDSVSATATTISYAFYNHGRVNGVRFTTATGATSITFTLDVNSQPATTSQIYLGSMQTPASGGSPLTFTR